MHNKNKGRWGERFATGFLIDKGYKIIDTNYSRKSGEIDIVAVRGNTIHFIEVKARSSIKYGQPLEAINRKKLKHIENTAQLYMVEKGYAGKYPMSIDAISIIGKDIMHIEGIYL